MSVSFVSYQIVAVDRKGCGGAIWTNVDVTSVIKRNDHIGCCLVDEHIAYKAGKKAKRYPKLTKHRPELQISDPFRATKTGGEFLLWQSASRRILVFVAIHVDSNIRLLAALQTCGMDGIFKVGPQWYQRLFTIYAFVAGNLLPVVCCLCTGEDIGTYGFIFQALINKAAVLIVSLNPQTIICDFQTALIPAIQGYFPKISEVNITITTNTCSWQPLSSPVLQVDTSDSLLEAGTMGNLVRSCSCMSRN
ncbi:hypothetical protein T4B_8802 [Trichinella pseudospiralis]|uniref:MULE transposase domain-containing protein n=1 Tax=Trichinella pseudospiralis TaxID=6337 RepID=A0A0V1IJ45_TRIPS|nr:hypothetical protein T4A_12093 [Trichinella pseudospiralis]KRZ22826.1 hypothetical protein T4B_8802 [Trichinella pseudospiralis]